MLWPWHREGLHQHRHQEVSSSEQFPFKHAQRLDQSVPRLADVRSACDADVVLLREVCQHLLCRVPDEFGEGVADGVTLVLRLHEEAVA